MMIERTTNWTRLSDGWLLLSTSCIAPSDVLTDGLSYPVVKMTTDTSPAENWWLRKPDGDVAAIRATTPRAVREDCHER